MIRLNKYLSEAGICSRREADRLIEAGRVTGCRTEGCSGSQQTGRYRVYRGYESEK